jgi:hypothetical protein
MKCYKVTVLAMTAVVIFMGTARLLIEIPETWDTKAIENFHLPPPDTTVVIKYAPREYYQSLPEHVIYKTFPVYVSEFEAPGYLDSLRHLEPEITFDPSTLKTREDWIKAGELVFNWPVAYTPFKGSTTQLKAAELTKGKSALTTDGRYAANRYVITEKGKLLVGSLSCASCHTHILESGEIVPGGQGNVVSAAGLANAVRSGKIPFAAMQQFTRQLTWTPWAPADFKSMPDSVDEIVRFFLSIPPGVVDRQGSGYLYPLAVPSLIGIKDIKYLDHTGVMKHESPADMMRYAAFNQGMDMLTSYNGYIPGGSNNYSEIPASGKWNHPFGYAPKRYSDAQLYALTQYLYSLKPPKNPNRFPATIVARGKKLFAQTGCVTCHTPPLYTNNKLTPANGFNPPVSHYAKYDIFDVSVETDSVSTLYSRRGTGYYKVPSLRGVWFRNAFFHNGNLTTLEEVLDEKRLHPDYKPSGYMPPNVRSMAVRGHPFGMELSEEDKKALVAFLKTL